MWILGGQGPGRHLLSTTQIVRPGKPTEPGPTMTEGKAGQCSTTLADGTVFVSGGLSRSNQGATARTEVYSLSTMQWIKLADMNQRRAGHSCTTAWLTCEDPDILSGRVRNTSILSTVVAGGKLNILYWFQHGLTHCSCPFFSQLL